MRVPHCHSYYVVQAWQSYATIQDSQGEVLIHALQLQKEMGMEYVSPKLPIEMINTGHKPFPFLDTSNGNSPVRTAEVVTNPMHESQTKSKLV
jgi:hypothetical protein